MTNVVCHNRTFYLDHAYTTKMEIHENIPANVARFYAIRQHKFCVSHCINTLQCVTDALIVTASKIPLSVRKVCVYMTSTKVYKNKRTSHDYAQWSTHSNIKPSLMHTTINLLSRYYALVRVNSRVCQNLCSQVYCVQINSLPRCNCST